MDGYLSKAQILGADDSGFEDVRVPEWGGGIVRVASMSGLEKDAFEASLTTITQQRDGKVTQKMNLANVRAKLAARCMVDENGRRLFEDADVLELGRKSAAALDRVIVVAKRLNAIDDADLKALTESLKNDPPADSLSG